MRVDIVVDTKGVLTGLERLSRQVPFAISKAMNESLKGAQKDIRATLPGHFTLRRKQFVERTVKITEFATKRKQVARLAVDPTRDILAKFEEDTRKQGQEGKSLAVPIDARPSETALVPKRLQIKALQLRPVVGRNGKRQLKGAKGTYTITTPRGTYVIQRVNRTERPVFYVRDRNGVLRQERQKRVTRAETKVLYAFKKSVPIKPTLGFVKTGTAAVDRLWPGAMRTAFDEAERTAR